MNSDKGLLSVQIHISLRYIFVKFFLIQSIVVEGAIQDQYLGCFYDLTGQGSNSDVYRDQSMTIESCIDHCKTSGLTYAKLQNRTDCICGDSFGTQLPDNVCNLTCIGNPSQFCGGFANQRISYVVYTVCPIGNYGDSCADVCHCNRQYPCNRMTGACPGGCDGNWTGPTCNTTLISERYLGCYKDNIGNRDLPFCIYCDERGKDNTVNTPELCSKSCGEANYTYAGTQYMYQCFCGDSYGILGQASSASECSSNCSGDSNQKCGGANRNSVYSVCPGGNYGSRCIGRCHCKDDKICTFRNGSCPSSQCRDGWKGISCNIRDCTMANGDCYSNETCSDVNLIYATVSQCRCSNGFNRKTTWENCTDIDECQSSLSLCDISTTDCTNIPGSYNCICKSGYERTGSTPNTTCTDIDECKDSRNCKLEGQYCINTPGSFRCICSNGYHINQSSGLCEDIDECTQEYCDRKSTNCTNTHGSYYCTCLNGYQSLSPNDNNTCSDIDECKIYPRICTSPDDCCRNTVGNYTCEKVTSSLTRDSNGTCTDMPPGPEPNKRNTIIGAVVGSVLGLLLILAIVFLILRRHKYRESCTKRIKSTKTFVNLVDRADSSPPSTLTGRAKSIYATDKRDTEGDLSVKDSLSSIQSKMSALEDLREEFDSPELLTTKDCYNHATENAFKKKNRFINILPYEENRVILQDVDGSEFSDYINASYISGYNDSDTFIATQGPKKETVEDFWKMILEQDITVIVMTTKLIENQKTKCEKYWPDLEESMVLGNITVKLLSEDPWPDYTVRRIQISQDSRTVETIQWHYLSWPDHNTPKDIKGFLNFREKVRKSMLPGKPTLVHCSAGAGRTGSFIAIDYLLEQEKQEHYVDVFACLKQLRDQRPKMIQNFEQYKFVHAVLLIALKLGQTTVETKMFPSKFKEWQQIDKKSGKSMIEKQYETLNELEVNPEDISENRVLSNKIEASNLTQMDAVFVQGWKLKDAYISLKQPGSVTDFWTLRREQGSTIIIIIGDNQVFTDSLLPSENKPIALTTSTLISGDITSDDHWTHYKVTELKDDNETYANVETNHYVNTGNVSARTEVNVFLVSESMMSGSEGDSLYSLYKTIDKMNAGTSKTAVPLLILTRRECVALGGFCMAALSAFDMIKHENEIDLLQVVLNVRKSKAELFNSLSSYVDLHKVVELSILS